MTEIISIDPKWRHGQPFDIYRNPDSKDRREILGGIAVETRSARFVYTGSSLYVGNSHRFTHYDSHTAMANFFDETSLWNGEVFLIRDWRNLDDFIEQNSNTPPHIIVDINPQRSAGLLRLSNYHERERGILDQSLLWRRFIVGLQLSFSKIEPLSGFVVNQPVTSVTRAYVVLHGDGHLYFFDRDIDRFEILDKLATAERALYPRSEWSSVDSVVGMQLGGNGNCHFDFAEVSNPQAVMLDNRNVRECFGEALDFEFSKSEICCRVRNVSRGKWQPSEIPSLP